MTPLCMFVSNLGLLHIRDEFELLLYKKKNHFLAGSVKKKSCRDLRLMSPFFPFQNWLFLRGRFENRRIENSFLRLALG